MTKNIASERAVAIAALLTEFCWCADNGRGDRIADLFTEKATVDTPNFNLAGKAEIHAWFSGRAGMKLSRHCWTNLRITPLGEDHYRAETNLMTTSGALPAPQHGGKLAICSSTDDIVFVGEEALFASRSLEICFEGLIVAEAVAA